MKASSMRYIFPQACKSLKINGWMTFAAIVTITISLFLCTFFWLLVVNIDANATQMESDVRIMAYIKDEVPDSDYAAIKEAIAALDGVDTIDFISKEDGIKSLSNRFGGIDLAATLEGANPLPDSYSVKAKTPEDVEPLAKSIGEIKQIEKVRYGEGYVENLFAFTDTIRKAGIAIMILLGLAAILLVAMNTRLTVYARRREVMVMKWVGATNSFIRWPFFLEGLLIGFIGAVISAVLVLVVYYNANSYLASTISFMHVVNIGQLWPGVFGFTILAGILMGAFGSIISLTRFLDV